MTTVIAGLVFIGSLAGGKFDAKDSVTNHEVFNCQAILPRQVLASLGSLDKLRDSIEACRATP